MVEPDLDVLTQAAEWLDAGIAVSLFTVARTWGAAPRPPGALLAIAADGRMIGSVSGGCIETELTERVRQGELGTGPVSAISFGVSTAAAQRAGMPCGGRLELVMEQLDSAAGLRPVIDALQARRRMVRRVCLTTGEASLHAAATHTACRYDGRDLYKLFGPTWRLVLIGAGQISLYLSQMAQAFDYEITVCDPRAEYAAAWSAPGTRLDQRMPDDAVRALQPDAYTAVVALTHDPRLDDMALLEALVSEAAYVGALGSAANQAKRRERLAALDLPPAAIGRLRGPVGLPLGGRSAPEIAVAILAELTALRHGRQLSLDAASDEGVRAAGG